VVDSGGKRGAGRRLRTEGSRKGSVGMQNTRSRARSKKRMVKTRQDQNNFFLKLSFEQVLERLIGTLASVVPRRMLHQ
jgi:hypothetical protein